MFPPSGEQFHLAAGSARAVVTEVGATLRRLELAGEDVVLSFAEGEMCRDGRGQVLAPWPNRLGDGRYRFGEREGVAALNEPERRNAIHGLVRWMAFRPALQSASEVVLETLLMPQPAYPWRLRLVVLYGLTEEELSVSVVATNESEVAAPFGIGFHPYLRAPGGVEGASLSLPAARHLLVDERALPCGDEPMEEFAHAAALTGAAPLGSRSLDDCFTELTPGPDGRWSATFSPEAGADRQLLVRGDASFGYAMVYSADELQGPERRSAVAVEPMTCPPDALRSGEGLVTLDPGGEFPRRILNLPRPLRENPRRPRRTARR